MPSFLKQTQFTGGELSPLLWGRTDLPRYGKGLRTMRNFFASKQGAAVSRPGSTFLGYAKTDSAVNLVPFVYSDGQSFVLEFGGNYIRFWSQGAQVLSAPMTPLEVATPFSDPFALRFVQSGDVLTICNGRQSLQPYDLTRITNTNWTLTQRNFANLLPWFTDLTGGVTTEQPMILVAGAGSGAPGTTSTTGSIPNTYPSDASHPNREWQWLVTAIAKDNATGRIFETLPVLVTRTLDITQADAANSGLITDSDPGQDFPVYPDRAVTLRRAPSTGLLGTPTGYNTWTPLGYCYYRGRGATETPVVGTGFSIPTGGLFGFVGQTAARDFVDVGDPPDFARQPPLGALPFKSNEYPLAVTYFQQRLVFGGTNFRPNVVQLSATADYYDFDPHTIDVAGEALVFGMDSRKRETILHLVPSTKLLALTDATVRSLSGQQGSPLDFDSVDIRLEEEIGTLDIVPPLVVDGMVIFQRSKGAGVRGLSYNWDKQGYVGSDLSLASQHLFLGGAQPNGDGYTPQAGNVDFTGVIPRSLGGVLVSSFRTIVSWTYAEDPWGVVWAVTADGSLLSLTFDAGEQVAGWARHDTDGFYLSVCAIPELTTGGVGTEDCVYAAVVRKVKGVQKVFMERLNSRVLYNTNDDNISLDAAIKATVTAASTTSITGLTHLEGKSVYVVGAGNPIFGPFVVDPTGTITLNDYPTVNNADGVSADLYIGLAFTCDIETLDIAQGEVRLKQKTVVSVGFEVDNARGIKAGMTFANAKEWVNRSVSDSYLASGNQTTMVRLYTQGIFDYFGRAVLRQELPIPVTVLGMTREVDVGD